jgi:hypothetical protein
MLRLVSSQAGLTTVLYRLCLTFTLALGVDFLSACSITAPVAVVRSKGEVLKGTATSTLTSGTFEVTNGQLNCAGNYDPSSGSRSVSLAVKCSDGRAGVGQAIRDTAVSGSGIVNMNDGTKATFIFGQGAINRGIKVTNFQGLTAPTCHRFHLRHRLCQSARSL